MYKTEAYYTILPRELEGKNIPPSSEPVPDAYVGPICLERAKNAGIPVVGGGSRRPTSRFRLFYGLNYFATVADFFVVHNAAQAKDVIRHITNKGNILSVTRNSKTVQQSIPALQYLAGHRELPGDCRLRGKIYKIFSIPLVHMIFVRTGNEYALSSLAPTRYTRLTEGERALLSAYLDHQEFL